MSRGDDAYRDLVGRGPVEGHEWFRPDVVRFSANPPLVGWARTGGLSNALLQLRAVLRGSTERDARTLSEARSSPSFDAGVNNAMKWS
jgi:hypothetical protein